MPDELTFLDQLEEWLESQVPPNLHELPYRMLETMERVSNEIFETLNMHGPPSISIPFPPFGGKEVPAPPPPPPPARFCPAVYHKAGRLVKAHPYAVGATAALALTVGLGLGGAVWKYGIHRRSARRCGTKGRVEDGMLKDAIVILSPTMIPPILWPLTVSLLRAGYVVLVAVPKVEDAEELEKKLAGLEERSALRVLIYDPEDSSTFPAFHRSLLATLTLRFPAPGKLAAGDPYNPQPSQIPRIHAFVSLYPMNPTPPSQPGALPALPTLLSPDANGKTPKLITLYPSASALVTPDTFASQVLSANHQLLGRNLSASSSAKIVSMFVGNLDLPVLQTMILSGGHQLSRRQQAKEQLRAASAQKKASIIKDYVFGSLNHVWNRFAAAIGLGGYSRNYAVFEREFLRALKRRHRREYHLGQYSILSQVLARLPLPVLPRVLSILPAMPGATGPLQSTVQGLPAPRKQLKNPDRQKSPASASASSSDHEGGDDLANSIHTSGTTSSRGMAAGSEGSGGSNGGLDESWVGLEAAN